MTTDERLERLKERHDALILSMELTSTENREHDRRLRQITDSMAALLAMYKNSLAAAQRRALEN